MVESHRRRSGRVAALLLAGTLLSGLPLPAAAQEAQPVPVAPDAPTSVAPEGSGPVRTVTVRGNERLEPETIRSYVNLNPGDAYDRERGDRALKDLYATELFADVTLRFENGELVVEVRENPVINRIVLEGNKRLKDDKIREEIRLAPRQIFTRSKARADVARIVELYKRSGRFAADVEPKIVQLDQNRVDVIFEIEEGAKSKVRAINIIGNERFSDGDLKGEMATKEARWYKIFTSSDTYDPDRMSFDQQKMRQFYLTNGYADFRVVSANAELTPDRRDFIITYVVEEGERYKFGDVEFESQIRDIKVADFKALIPIEKGDWYDAKRVEDTVDSLTQTAGLFGYAFADVRPQFNRDREAREMNLTFNVAEAPRVYVDRISITGNVLTHDKVIRREFRLAEGDAFNSFKVKRSRDRIQSLGFFQENLEIEQKQGTTPDKVSLEVAVEEKATGQLQVSAGFSSLEKFILNLSISQSNFRGRGQQVNASVNYSSYSKGIELGFTEPYLFGKNIALGGTVFRRDYDSGNFFNTDNRAFYEQTSTGFVIRAGTPLTEYWQAAVRYGLSVDNIDLGELYFRDTNNDGVISDAEKTEANCIAGSYVCESLGERTTSSVGYTIAYNNLNNRIRPTSGHSIVLNQDLAGVGGGVKYLRTSIDADKYWGIGDSGFVFGIGLEGGYIASYGGDRIRINDRFFLGEPRMRGFDIRGLGPRIVRYARDENNNVLLDQVISDQSLGGRAYYLGRLELEVPLGSGGRELGFRPSLFTDVGAVFDIDRQPTLDQPTTTVDVNGTPVVQPGFTERFLGDSPKPRLSVGAGVSWNSPFGPFRIDIAKALLKEEGDDTQLFQFNVGTQF